MGIQSKLNKQNKENVISNSVTNRTFDYSKGGISLNFTLRIDIKKDLNSFLELLKVAIVEVEAEINK
jgi:uncharacterized protein YdgA (DUF945 family)